MGLNPEDKSLRLSGKNAKWPDYQISQENQTENQTQDQTKKEPEKETEKGMEKETESFDASFGSHAKVTDNQMLLVNHAALDPLPIYNVRTYRPNGPKVRFWEKMIWGYQTHTEKIYSIYLNIMVKIPI